LATLPQILARISHANHGVWCVVKYILERLLLEFPHQAMWGMMMLLNTTDTDSLRFKRATKVFSRRVLDLERMNVAMTW
jgi:hypothetical protein